MIRGKMICKICGKNTTHRVVTPARRCSLNYVHPEMIHPDDKRRVSQKLCPRCFKKELKQLLFDEVGGILGNIEFHDPEPQTLVALAKALVYHGLTKYYKASEYLVFRALKDNQIPEDNVLMMPDGDKTTLNKKYRGY